MCLVLGYPITGAQVGGGLGSAIYGAFSKKDEMEADAADATGVPGGVGNNVTVRNTVVHIGSIINENRFEVTESVDVRQFSEELALQTEGNIREILV